MSEFDRIKVNCTTRKDGKRYICISDLINVLINDKQSYKPSTDIDNAIDYIDGLIYRLNKLAMNM